MTLLAEAADHVDRDSPAAARRLVEDTLSAGESLLQFPHRGRFVPELGDSLHRELFVGRYRLIYVVGTDRIAIVAFVHSARDFRGWWAYYLRKIEPS